jgi:hypothetical protein
MPSKLVPVGSAGCPGRCRGLCSVRGLGAGRDPGAGHPQPHPAGQPRYQPSEICPGQPGVFPCTSPAACPCPGLAAQPASKTGAWLRITAAELNQRA